MYETFFELAARPFLAAGQADRYFPAATVEEARQNLARTILRSEGPGLVIGAAGTGKSMLCQVLAKQLSDDYSVAMLNSARLCTRRALLQAILHQLGLPFKGMEEGELRLSLIDYLDEMPEGKKAMVLLLDEAHALPLRLLEEVRMITNFARDGESRVRLILAGAPSLEERFASPQLESFNQRVAARCYLQPLDRHETSQFVVAQLAACGQSVTQAFSDDALQAIHHATGGVPRLINQVCDHAMVLAYAGGVRQIDASGIEEAWADLQQLPIPFSPERSVAGESGASDAGASDVVEFGSLDDLSTSEALSGEENTFESVPFSGDDQGIEDPADQVDRIQEHVTELEEDFQPAGVIGPEVELVFASTENPFDESFDSEEVVIDRYAQIEDSLLRDRPKVNNQSDHKLSEMLAAPSEDLELRLTDQPELEETKMPEEQAVESASSDTFSPALDPVLPDPALSNPVAIEPWNDKLVNSILHDIDSDVTSDELEDEHDVILIDDDPDPVAPVHPRVHRKEYRQLFAKLRQG